MKIDRGIVQCDRCKRVFKTKEVNNYKISYQAGGLKSDGGCGLVTKKQKSARIVIWILMILCVINQLQDVITHDR